MPKRYPGRFTIARDVVAFFTAGLAQLVVGDQLSTRELSWMYEREHVAHLSDVLTRRADLGFTGTLSPETVHAVAAALSKPAGWDAKIRDAEIARLQVELPGRVGESPSLGR